MISYPDIVPMDAILLTTEIVKSRQLQERKQEFAHAAWNVQGYIQRVTLGAPSPVIALYTPEDDSEETIDSLVALHDTLESYEQEGVYMTTSAEENEEPGSIITIVSIVTITLQLLRLWLENRQKEDNSEETTN